MARKTFKFAGFDQINVCPVTLFGAAFWGKIAVFKHFFR